MIKNILKYLLSLGLAVGLLYWNFKDADFKHLFDQLAKADLSWVALSTLLTLVAHWSRAARWKMLLQPLGYSPSILNTTLAVWAGYFSNFIIPRAGEVSRCTVLQNTDEIPFEKSFGTVVTERIFDMITLLVLILLNFMLEFERLSQFFIDFFKTKVNTNLLIVLGLIFVLGLILTAVLYLKFKEKIQQIPALKKIENLALGLVDGLLSIRNLKNPLLFLGHTVLIWAMYYLMTYVLFFAMPQTSNLGLLAGLTILVMGALGTAAPTPGGVGTYHILVGSVVVLYGLNAEDGQLLATFSHGSQMITMLVLGGIASVWVLFRAKKK
jgi:uncharacterized protein (TIRG00374 family)